LHTVIIGNGIAGITCARHLRKQSDERITVISGETDHFYSRTALMYIFMGHMRYEHTKPYEDWFWSKNRIDLKRAWVSSVDTENKVLRLDDAAPLNYDRLVLATGSRSRLANWKGLDLQGVHSLYSIQDVRRLDDATNLVLSSSAETPRAVVVGGGLIGVELCEMFRSRGLEVTLLVREACFWGNVLSLDEGRMVEGHLASHGVEVLTNTELESIQGESGRVSGVRLDSGASIDCSIVALAIGVEPNVDWLKDSSIELRRGVLVDRMFRTNVQDVYAIGDCAEFRDPPPVMAAINQVWYTGRMMGETLSQILIGKDVKYNPGPWFNSAKFFDLEYQTYGQVAPVPKPGEQHFFWRDLEGRRCVKVVFDSDGSIFLGINTIGFRVKHELMATYLEQKATVQEVLQAFQRWNFDPEFTGDFHSEVLEKWNTERPDLAVKPKRRRAWF
jgi:3-phenylpropionate/trans-cinnamate dioxygenase ferredoxin reductase component